jgi:UDP-3-O-acyl N-acetylglucosamine deacetylase
LVHAPRFQNTLARCARVHGFGFWSSQDVSVEFQPAEPDTGLVFVRRDLAGQPEIAVHLASRREAQRRTVLASGAATVEMVEHVLAALTGLQIDNCRIAVDAPELPGMDGSSLPFVEALQQAGRICQPRMRACLQVKRPLRVGDANSWIEAQPADARVPFGLDYRLDYEEHPAIGAQSGRYRLSIARFVADLAPARTFILQHEAEWLREQGLALRATPRDLLVFAAGGPIDNPLRFADECVRHKMLDVLGDFALAGCDLVGKFTAYRSGHRLNAELIARLLEMAAVDRHRTPVRRSA